MRNITSDRVIRVFISSTFKDMKAERDYLVKFIFPSCEGCRSQVGQRMKSYPECKCDEQV